MNPTLSPLRTHFYISAVDELGRGTVFVDPSTIMKSYSHPNAMKEHTDLLERFTKYII